MVTPTTFALPPGLEHDGNHIVLDGGAPDPLSTGFVLVGGMLAVLPKKVQLTHTDEQGRTYEGDEPPGPQDHHVVASRVL